MKDDAVYLRHIMECIRRAQENTSAGYVAFVDSHTLQDAVLRNLQTLAESTQRLPDVAKSEGRSGGGAPARRRIDLTRTGG